MVIQSKTFIATPPGKSIKEQLKNRKMSQKEFAKRMNLSEKHISALINGEVQLTPDVALRLEMVLGVPARFWSKLEAIYREKIVKANEENEMEEDIKLLKKYPYKEMTKHDWIENKKTPKEKVFQLRQFFEVVKLSALDESLLPNIACRKLGEGDKTYSALITWAQKAKLEAREIETKKVNINKLKKFLPTIREMTTQDPSVFCPKLQEGLSECGIALVFLPHFNGSFLHGASFYDGNKIVIGMTVRGKDADKFWFSLFHELGHVILGHLKNLKGTTKEDESKADLFAQNTLIPEENFKLFISKQKPNKKSILEFSKEMDIDPGIILGRLQKEKIILYSLYNDLKTKYSIM